MRTCDLPRVLSPEYVDVFHTGFVSTVPEASDSPSPARTCPRALVCIV